MGPTSFRRTRVRPQPGGRRHVLIGPRGLLVPLALLAASCSPGSPRAPRNVIVFISDGAGVGHWTLAKLARAELAVDSFPVGGLVQTGGYEHALTESAAGATALSTGVRTRQGWAGLGPDSLPRETVLEAAMRAGKAAGLVTTTAIVDATPAAFGAHAHRGGFLDIKRQMLGQRINVLMGGGRRFFETVSEGGAVDLVAEQAEEYAYVGSAGELSGMDLGSVTHLLGLFAEGSTPDAGERSPTLPQMTSAALEILARDPEGFFLMVENEGSDDPAHRNVPADALAAEMLEFDDAVRVALTFQRANPRTLVLVTADHETGGLTLPADTALPRGVIDALLDSLVTARGGSGAPTVTDSVRMREFVREDADRLARLMRAYSTPQLRYATGEHTAALVPLFAIGPGAERFGGLKENRRVGELLLEAIRN